MLLGAFLVVYPPNAARSQQATAETTTEPGQEVANGPTDTGTAEVSYTLTAYVTGYNTVPGQTDDTPCIAAGGNICGRMDVVACPTDLPLYSWVRIEGKEYQCMDRTAGKHNGRFDISCDKDMQCPYRITGTKTVEVIKKTPTP